MLRKSLILLLVVFTAFWGYGYWLDNKAVTHDLAMYERDNNNIIKGTEPFEYKANNKKAIILVHGFMSNPAVYKPLFTKLKALKEFNIFAPLLPFHSRTITSMSKMDNQVITDYLSNTINDIAQKHDEVILVGFSYGGAQLIKLAHDKQIPEKAKLIFLSPAYFIRSDSLVGETIAIDYGMWRNFCRSSLIKCGKEANGYIKSADKEGNKFLVKYHKQLAYDVLPAVKALYAFDQNNQYKLKELNKPHTILMAKDDVLVDYSAVKSHCDTSPSCKLISYPHGNHYFLIGKPKQQVEDKIIELIMENNHDITDS